MSKKQKFITQRLHGAGLFYPKPLSFSPPKQYNRPTLSDKSCQKSPSRIQ